MDIEFLKTFLEVNRTRHFGRAAENLFVTQSTVSARIRQLEEDLGAALFTRTRNDIQLTATGRRLLKFAENILTTWNRARQEIAIEDEQQVPLSVAGLPSLWDINLQEWLHHLVSHVPDVMINAEVLVPDVMIRRLNEGTLDIGFMFDAPQSSTLQVEQVALIRLILVSSEAGRIASEAVNDRYVLVDWGTSFAIAHARHFPDMMAPSLHMGLGRMAHEFLLARGGSAYLAEPMVADDLDRGRLYVVEDAPVIERSASVVFAADSDKRTMIDRALSYFRPAAVTDKDTAG